MDEHTRIFWCATLGALMFLVIFIVRFGSGNRVVRRTCIASTGPLWAMFFVLCNYEAGLFGVALLAGCVFIAFTTLWAIMDWPIHFDD